MSTAKTVTHCVNVPDDCHSTDCRTDAGLPANFMASWYGMPSNMPTAKAPVKQSPAPVVSTTCHMTDTVSANGCCAKIF